MDVGVDEWGCVKVRVRGGNEGGDGYIRRGVHMHACGCVCVYIFIQLKFLWLRTYTDLYVMGMDLRKV